MAVPASQGHEWMLAMPHPQPARHEGQATTSRAPAACPYSNGWSSYLYAGPLLVVVVLQHAPDPAWTMTEVIPAPGEGHRALQPPDSSEERETQREGL